MKGSEASAERAWRVANGIVEERDADFDAPRPSVLVGEYQEEFGATAWDARAGTFKAAERGKIDAKWYDGHVRLIPSPVPPATDRDGPWSGGAEWRWPGFEDSALEDEAPALHSALSTTWDDAGVMGTLERFAECAAFWDAVELMEAWGVDAATAHAGDVVCRLCGSAVDDDIREHLVDHGEKPADYRAKYPAAPLTADERKAMPPGTIRWR